LPERIAVSGAGRGEHDLLYSHIEHRIQQREAIDEIVAVILARMPDGLACLAVGREMKYRIDLVLANRRTKHSRITQIGGDERAPTDRPAMTGAEIVLYVTGVMPAVESALHVWLAI